MTARFNGPTAAEISRMLAQRMEELAADLLRGGAKTQNGHEWCAGDVFGSKGDSCKVVIKGEKRGVWKDFATGEGGDALDLVAANLCTDTKGALAWARGWLGIGDAPSGERRSPRTPPADASAAKPDPGLSAEERARRAVEMWHRADPVRHTAAEAYLRARGIRMDLPPTLRFYSGLRHGPSGKFFPCLIGAVCTVDRRITAVWRIYLDRGSDGAWGKAPVEPVKMGYGPSAGCAVRLSPLKPQLAVGEGIETSLAIAQAYPEMAVWAALSTSGMKSLVLPPEVTEVTLCIDGDGPGRAAAAATAERLQREGRTVRIADPGPCRDFNDFLKGA